jgi:hypothetical protein
VFSHDALNAFGRAWLRLVSHPAAWCALGITYVILAKLELNTGALVEHLGDSDDATRLVSVRELIAGAPWFDTTLSRIGAPEPLLLHWSRLIDFALASGFVVLRPFLGMDGAELGTRIVWPVLLLYALMLVTVREIQIRAGTRAAVFAVLLIVTCETALVQFRPGRIDHHNVQVLCAVAGVLLLARGLRNLRLGIIAGSCFGLGLACGLEAMALIVAALAFAAFLALRDPRYASGILGAAGAATVVLILALLATIPPSRWLDIRCDTLALNLPVLALICTAGLWAALRTLAAENLISRYAVAGSAALAGIVAYLWLEPACLGGPMGQLNPALNHWLGQVMETRGVSWLIVNHPAAGLSFLAFVAAGAAAQISLLYRKLDADAVYTTAVVLLGVLLGLWQIRLTSYASWLVIPPLAIWCASLRGNASISRPVATASAVVLLSQMSLGLIVGSAVAAVRHVTPPVDAAQYADTSLCYWSSALRPLSAQPAGLVAADIDLGPFIVAMTPHSVIAAPYHRLDKGILAAQTILHGAPDRALAQMRRLGAGYLVLCAVPGQRTTPGSIRAELLAGRAIPTLTEISMPPGSPIRAWRVDGGR